MNKNCPDIYVYKRIVQAKLYIDLMFCEPIDLRNIADEAYFSKFHFTRLFKKIFGYTPHQYLTMVRISNARLLLQQHKSVSATCFAVGHDGLPSFTALFKKRTNSTPSMYQQEFIKRAAQIKRMPLQFIPNCFAAQADWPKQSNFQEVV